MPRCPSSSTSRPPAPGRPRPASSSRWPRTWRRWPHDQAAEGNDDTRHEGRPGATDRNRLPRPVPERDHRPQRGLRAHDARDARSLLRIVEPGCDPARGHRRDLLDPGVLRLPELAHQLCGATPDPVRHRVAGGRDQDREPRCPRDRRHHLDGPRLADALRFARGWLPRILVGDRADGGRDGGTFLVRGRRGRARARAAAGDRGRRAHRQDRQRPGAARPRRPGVGLRRDLACGRRGRARRDRGPGADRRGRRSHAEGHKGRGQGRSRMITMDSLLLIVALLVALFFIGSFARILREYERAVIFRLGRSTKAILNPGGQGNGPGLVLLVPLIDKMVKVSMQTVALDVAPQDVITRDNVSLKVSAVIYFRVVDPQRAVIAVQDYLYATSQIAQTTLRSVLGQVELDDLLSARDKINQQLQRIIDEHTDPWGIKVTTVEVKHIDLPQDMQRAMAKQAEAERERRAKVINADGEFQAAAKLAEAAEVLTRYPVAVQLRYLQTMREIASERNTTTFFPLPMDLLTLFGGMNATKDATRSDR